MAVARDGFVEVWEAARRRLSSGGLPPLTVIAGEAPFVKERLVEAAVAGHGGEVETFAVQAGENDRTALRRLLDVWTTATLFGAGHLIVARDAGGLLKGDGLAALEAVLERDGVPHRLLLTLPSLDGRSKLARRLKTDDGFVNLPVLRDSPPPWHAGGPFLETDLNQWLVAEARLQGHELDLAAADALTTRLGNEPGRLAQKLAQLGVLLGRSPTAQDVTTHVPHSSVRLLGLYEDALFAGQVGTALELVDRMQRDGVHDPFQKLVAGPLVADTVLRGLVANLARLVEAHGRLDERLLAALRAKPWQRAARDGAALDDVLGKGGRRVFLERDLRRSTPRSARAAFRVALSALRALRDGAGGSLHAVTARLARALGPPARAPERARGGRRSAAW